MVSRALMMIAVFLLVACTSPEKSDAASPVIADYVAAYNDGDVEAMATFMHPDIQWLAVVGADISVMAEGKDSLVTQMTAYVESGDATRSDLSGWGGAGRFVSVTETAEWKKDDGSMAAQSSIAVYELEGDLIRRVWYYPAQS